MATVTSLPVGIGQKHVGNLLISEGRTQFVFTEEYWKDPVRPVLGLHFEDTPGTSEPWVTGLPNWFENIVPEGTLREVVARTVGADVYSSLKILRAIGVDLPGAVVLGESFEAEAGTLDLLQLRSTHSHTKTWNFSLAGYFLKLSAVKKQGRITLPAYGEFGNCILKFPSASHPDLPLNEFWMMSLAQRMGFDVPEIFQVHREDLPKNISEDLWPTTEEIGFGIVRFDRDAQGGRIHMEDFAQILNKHPQDKYRSNFETVGKIVGSVERNGGIEEFVRRLTLNILIGNGDAHLKNWSVLYPDGRNPRLSPLYDLVCDGIYTGKHNLGMRFGGTMLFPLISRATFEDVSPTLGVDPGVVLSAVDSTCSAFERAWAELHAEMPQKLRTFVERHSADALRRLQE